MALDLKVILGGTMFLVLFVLSFYKRFDLPFQKGLGINGQGLVPPLFLYFLLSFYNYFDVPQMIDVVGGVNIVGVANNIVMP